MNDFRFAACVALLLAMSKTGAAWAQPAIADGSPPSAPSFEGEKTWRSLFAQASVAFSERRFVQAKDYLLRAAEIKMTPKIAANLAQVEVQLGQYLAAANHAAEALASLGGNQGVEADLATASKYVAKLIVRTNLSGVRITIDGDAVGLTPMQHAVYVDAGPHIVGVDKPGYVTAKREITSAPGSEQFIAFELVNEPTSTAPSKPVLRDLPPVATTVSLEPVAMSQFDVAPSFGASRTLMLLTGGVLTTAGVATGLVFNAKANRDERHADALSQRLGSDGCVAMDGTHAAQCMQLRDERTAHDRARDLSTAGFVAGGVGLVATALVLSWPGSRSLSDRSASLVRPVRLKGSVTPSASWILLSAGF
ncbi:MAG TPA: PEGA domain-containing protein [Polyangiaceae bacterium]